MGRIIDYLAEELKKQEATKTRKAGKRGRIKAMMKALQPPPLPLLDEEMAVLLGMSAFQAAPKEDTKCRIGPLIKISAAECQRRVERSRTYCAKVKAKQKDTK